MRALEQPAQRRVTPLQARVHIEAAEDGLDVDGHVARPRHDARGQRARCEHLGGDVECERLAELARARKEGTRLAVHALVAREQVRDG